MVGSAPKERRTHSACEDGCRSVGLVRRCRTLTRMTDLIGTLKVRVGACLSGRPALLLVCDTSAITTALPHVSSRLLNTPINREASPSCRIDGGGFHLPRAERVVLIPCNLIDTEVCGISSINVGAVVERVDALTEGDSHRLPAVLCPDFLLPLLCDLAWGAPP